MQYVVPSSLNSTEPIMLINKHIGFDANEGMGIDGAIFQQELLQLDGMGYKSIKVWINSPGGVVTDGFNIFSAILKSETPVDTYNAGMCASIAGAIFMAGRKRTMADYASLMMHNPEGSDDKKMMDTIKDSIVTMLSSKAKIAAPEVEFLMNRTTWMNAAECFAKGFCTDIEVTSESNKKRMPVLNTEDASTWKSAWKEANLIVNNIFQQTENTEMKKVTNRLKLVDGANEDAIVESINAIENRATKAEGEVVAAKAEVTKLTDKVTALEAENQKFKDEKAADEKKVKDAEEAAELTAITNLVEKGIAAGKFKVDTTTTKDSLIETYKKLGSVELGKIVDSLTISKVGNKIETGAPGAGKLTGLSNAAAQAMAEVKARLTGSEVKA